MLEEQGAVDRFASYLSSRGLRLTRQRQAIAEVFFEDIDGHPSLQDILDVAKGRQSSIGYATVYRTMRLLTEGGFAEEHKFGENHARFEPVVEGEHHDHLICADCGRIVEFEDQLIERRQEAIAASHSFKVVSHRHEVYVSCLREPCEHRTSDT